MSSHVAIITGAAQGIGRGIALRLAKDGLDLVLNDIPTNADRLEEVVVAVRLQGREAIGVPGDAADEADVDKLVQVAVEQFGGLDVFVANAGILLLSPVLETTLEQWDKLMRVNARSVFIGYKAAAKQMIKQGRGGRIIGACSVAGKRGEPMLSLYSGSKFFVRGLTQAAAREWKTHGITVNAYAPGVIDTPMGRKLQDEIKANNADPDGLESDNSLRSIQAVIDESIGTPEDVAGLVSYLASKNSQFLTGQTINIDGGMVFD